jgi:ribosomal protein S6
VKRYEALFIFHNPTSEEGIKDVVDKVSQDIHQSGGKVGNVQKMDRKSFTRVTDKKVTSGFYANVLFTAAPTIIDPLKERLLEREEVYRVMISNYHPTPEPTAAPELAAS